LTDPILHNQARRRISWSRWLRQVNGSQSGEDSMTSIRNFLRSLSSSWHFESPSIFEDPKKNSGISKGPFHGDYQDRPATRSLKRWESSTTARTSNS